MRMTLGAEAVDREVTVQKEESEVVLLPEADNPTYCEVMTMPCALLKL